MPIDAKSHSSYPRPDVDRSARWLSLDGSWDFFADPESALDVPTVAAAPATEEIMVPGCWEQNATGGRHDWLEQAWYRREIRAPGDWSGERVILTLGAVFHACDVWVNGHHLGSSDSGYLPVELDVTDALADLRGTLVVRVRSPRDKRDIPHGKQRSIPCDDYDGCSFTPSSGIWQSVWIEPRPRHHIARARLRTSPTLDGIDVDVTATTARGTVRALLEAEATRFEAELVGGAASFTIPVSRPHLWSQEDPHLYFVALELVSEDDGIVTTDRVRVYTGLRTFEARDGAFFLNGSRTYLRGVLDQGYWPRTGMAAPDEAALVRDLDLAAASGFNLVRKHLKAEDPRWLFAADTAGMLVWSEPACTGRYSPDGAAAFEREIAGLVDRDANHPSIVIWGAYNEEWGLDWDLQGDQRRRAAVVRAYELFRTKDPTRPVVDNSGWTHVRTDILDWHYYNEDPQAFREAIDRFVPDPAVPFDVWHSPTHPVAKSMQATGFVRTGQPIMNSEYGGGWNSLARAWHSRWQTQFMRVHDQNQGYVYTELYDIENETVGIFTFDRGTKDQDGFEQAWAHSQTVIAPMVAPVTYGTDVVAAPGTRLIIPVVVSHHGPSPVDGVLHWSSSVGDGSCTLRAEPFRVSPPAEVGIDLPDSFTSARVWLTLAVDGSVIATTFVDVRHARPGSHLPQGTTAGRAASEGAS